VNSGSASGRNRLRFRLPGSARLALVSALAAGLWVGGGSQARAYSNCPAGQIPAFSGSGCVAPQQNPSLGGYGIPSQANNLPHSGLNGAPAIQRCNGSPVPFGQPCPGTVIPATTSGQAGSAGAGAGSPYGISVALAPSTSSVTVAPPVPYTPPAAVSGTGGSTTSAVAATPPANPTAALQGLLGDWYSSWIAYTANALTWSDAQTTQVTAYLASVAPCSAGQKDACEAFIYQQLQVWLNQQPSAPTGGS
jgi:hypothetical protein